MDSKEILEDPNQYGFRTLIVLRRMRTIKERN